jgi:hypothetical protein
MKTEEPLLPSGRRNPCPVCGRTTDGDCRIGVDVVLCHHGKTAAPPDALAIGEVIKGWAYTGESSDGRCSVFTRHKPSAALQCDSAAKVRPRRQRQPRRITLAMLPIAAAEPPPHLDGQQLTYGPDQWITVVGKRFIPNHSDEEGRVHATAGQQPWPLYRQQDAIEHARNQWVVEMEGEKCCRWVMAAGRVGISQPGHNHTQDAITRRYRELKAAGVEGVVYVADNDQTGIQKAQKCSDCAEEAGLPFLCFPAVRIWGEELPSGGSIDDAQGSAVERFCAIEVAIEDHLDLTPEAQVEGKQENLTVLLERCAQRALELPLEHRSHTLRSMAKALGASLTSRDADRLLASARSRRDGSGARRRGHRTLEVKATPWIWEDLLIGRTINIMGALPKVGKTSLLIQAIAAWHHGAPSFLSQRFIGPCPPVILIGTDQPAADWARMLQGAHLHAGADPDGVTTPVREIWTMEDSFVLNEEGLEVCGELAQLYPEAIFLIDSVAAAVTNPLGIPEESAEIAEPLRRLQAVVGLHGGTSVFIAHAGKGRAGEDPIRSLRGSTSLPAVASQILGLARLSETPGDDRLILQTQGRGGHPLRLLLSRDSEGRFLCDGDAASAIISERLQQAESKLTEDQADALQILRNRHAEGLETAVADLAIDDSRQALDRARTLLKGLKRAGLATSRMSSTASGRRELWEPFKLQVPGPHRNPSDPSHLSNSKGCEASEGSEALPVGPLSQVTFELISRCAESLYGESPDEITLCCFDQYPELQNEQLDDLLAVVLQTID